MKALLFAALLISGCDFGSRDLMMVLWRYEWNAEGSRKEWVPIGTMKEADCFSRRDGTGKYGEPKVCLREGVRP